MRLVNAETLEEIKTGDVVGTLRGQTIKLVYSTPPHKPSSTGRVYVENVKSGFRQEFFPTVIGAKFID